jgi:hypothetical protein
VPDIVTTFDDLKPPSSTVLGAAQGPQTLTMAPLSKAEETYFGGAPEYVPWAGGLMATHNAAYPPEDEFSRILSAALRT